MPVTANNEDARKGVVAGWPGSTWVALRKEWPICLSVGTAILFAIFGKAWLGNLASPWWAGFMFGWLFGAVLLSAFAVVRHADCLAIKLGEPYGTLILTLSVIGMEVMMVSAVMVTGGSDPTLARDTMFSVLMIVLNGLFGLALLAGGWRHGEQQYNLQGAVSYLAMLVPLAMLSLVMPAYEESTMSPALKTARVWALGLTSIGLYGVFLAVQTRRHPGFFVEPGARTFGRGDRGTGARASGRPLDAVPRSPVAVVPAAGRGVVQETRGGASDSTTFCSARSSRSASFASTIISERSPFKTCCSRGSATPCSSRSGTASTSRAYR